MKTKIERLNSMKGDSEKAKAQEISDQNRLEVKVHLLELLEKNANNRYQNALVQINELDDHLSRLKKEVRVRL